MKRICTFKVYATDCMTDDNDMIQFLDNLEMRLAITEETQETRLRYVKVDSDWELTIETKSIKKMEVAKIYVRGYLCALRTVATMVIV